MRKWILRLLLALLLLVALALVAGWLALRGSLPALDGEAPLQGLAARALIERDARGTASVHARSETDAARALGYLHAQERYFEMDLMRRSAAGELSALFGAAALPMDRAARMHRLRMRAGEVIAAEPAGRRAVLDAYAEGANAGLQALRARPWPYLLLRAEPAAWRSEDSALVVLAMFMDLQDENNRRELGLLQFRRHLDPQLFALLRSDGTPWDAPLFGEPRPPLRVALSAGEQRLPAAEDAGSGAPAHSGHHQATPAGGTAPVDAPGSNNFAVAGALTNDGRALVANDMHLGLRVPGVWMPLRLRYGDARAPGGEVDVTGVSLPGLPGVIAGSNGHVAWGFTAAYGDAADWIEVEWLDADQRIYRTPEGSEAVQLHEEPIEVAGGSAETLVVPQTRWGPLLHEDGSGGLALAWTAHRPGGVDFSLMELAVADSIEQAVSTAQGAGMPALNLVAGDRRGRIAWTLTGRIPQRTGGCDAQLPLRPLEGCDWRGWVAETDIPELVDPPHHRLWTANARVLDGQALALVGDGGYDLGARQRQIRNALFALPQFDEQALLDIQLDDRALFLERWWMLLRDTVEDPDQADDAALQELAAASAVWDGRAAIDSASYRLARAFRLRVHDLLHDRLLEPVRAAEGDAFVAPRLPQFEGLVWALLEQRPPVLPGGATVEWPALLAGAARDVVDELKTHGEDLSLRTWGERNTAAIRHPLSGALPGWLGGALDMPREPLPGDSNMPRVQAPGFGASERFVVAPGHEQRGIMHLPGGASGHPLSPFHAVGHADWVAGRPTPFLPGAPMHRLVLQPAGS